MLGVCSDGGVIGGVKAGPQGSLLIKHPVINKQHDLSVIRNIKLEKLIIDVLAF